MSANALEILRRASCQGAQIKTRQPFAFQIRAGRRQPRGLVTEVEDLIRLSRGRAQPSVGFPTDFQFQSARERERHEHIVYFHRRLCSLAMRNSLVARNVLVSHLFRTIMLGSMSLVHIMTPSLEFCQ